MKGVIHIEKECGLIRNSNYPKLDIQRDVETQNDLFAMPDYRSGGAAVALIKAVWAAANAQGWGVVRWITRDHNYCARGIYDKLAEKAD